jgi:hypothetical protein
MHSIFIWLSIFCHKLNFAYSTLIKRFKCLSLKKLVLLIEFENRLFTIEAYQILIEQIFI